MQFDAVCPQFHMEDLNLETSTPLGAGAISYVVKSTLRGPLMLPIVVKIISKLQVLQQNKVNSVMNEKAALIALQPHPFIGRLYGTSQSEDELYFVMENLPHGDLLQHIRRTAAERVQNYTTHSLHRTVEPPHDQKTSEIVSLHDEKEKTIQNSSTQEDESNVDHKSNHLTPLQPIPASSHALRCLDFHDIQFITAQLILALAHVANKNFVLRDLKPENVVFDNKYRACLIDFDTVDLEGEHNTPETNHGNALPERLTSTTSKSVNLKSNEHSQSEKAHSTSLSEITKECSEEHKQETLKNSSQEDEKGCEKERKKESHKTCSSNSNASDKEEKASHASCARRRITVSQIQEMRRRTASFCGTAQYVSPEMVGECKWSFSSDLWALGAMVYEMMYGVHLFTGSSTFYVLQKVIKGLGSVAALGIPFPYIDFTTEHTTSGWCDKGKINSEKLEQRQDNDSSNANEKDLFARVKDFIVKVMQIDPRKRLGVNAETNTFDLHALQSHMLFDDFDWGVLEVHIRDYKARTFHAESTYSSSRGNVKENNEKKATDVVMCNNNSNDDDDATTCEYVDNTPSLRDFYHKLPRNDDKYAEYVAKATADANPFERFMNMICMTDAPDGVEELHGNVNGGNKNRNSNNNIRPNAGNKDVNEEEFDNMQVTNNTDAHTDTSEISYSDESEIEVIDDVGVHYTGHEATEDFQESESSFKL